jgi:adenylosuccinate lyase
MMDSANSDTYMYTHTTYLSPFTWRYGSDPMRRLWSEHHKRLLWRRLWVALAEAQQAAGLVTAEQVVDLRAHQEQVDVERAHQIEAEIHHDLMAEIHTFAEQATVGAPIIHLGATSMDIEDNADALRLREALDLTMAATSALLAAFATAIKRWADTPAMAFTHLQPAEPTTLGYRLAQYAQDLLLDLEQLRQVRSGIRGKGIKGAVGTSASYGELLAGTSMTPAQLEARVMAVLELPAFTVATQTYTRKQDLLVLNALAGVAASLYKFAFDLRLLQSPPIGEWSEPFGSKQVGSSAMPFKRNPINAEKIDSLARYVAQLPGVAWHNTAHNLLERTLDDSANRRIILPNAFLAVDELLRVALRLVQGLRVDEAAVARTLATYGTFAATERVLMAAVKAGADRQQLHDVIRTHSLAAWANIAAGQPNPLIESLAQEQLVRQYLSESQIRTLLNASHYVGDAPQRARALVKDLEAALGR